MRRGRVLFAVFAALAIALLSAGSVLYSRITAPGPSIQPTLVYFPPGGGFNAFPQKLKDAGLIPSRRLFALAAVASGATRHLQSGEYEIPAQASILDILRLLRTGRQYQRLFTVAEGLSSAEIAAKLAAEPMLSGPVGDIPPEGSLLPETYAFTRNDARAALLRRMAQAHDRALADLWAGRAAGLALATPAQAVALASIVEKETGKPEERPHVAAVYMNRLRQGIKLQADPTVAYGLKPGAPLGRTLTLADLAAPTPYNTYVNPGLPPGPIANPGKAALAAVLHPAASDDLYFVADGSGGHAFARTLAEHQQNVRRWRALNGELTSGAKPAAAGPEPAPAATSAPARPRPKARGKK